MSVEVPDVIVKRLEALASASGKSVDDLAHEALESLVGSPKARRAILRARRVGAKAEVDSLADLGWLDGYAGQAVDELLLYEGMDKVHSILFALEAAIEEKVKTAGPLQRTGVELIVQSVLALDREVNNGGYDQYFRNPSRRYARVVVSHLAMIGCTEIADITQHAIDSLGIPEVSVPAIEGAMQIENVERDRALHRCDLAFYDQKGLLERLFSYVKAHQDGIRI
ncbi:MAG: DUF4375 domain-containing protein [Acidobacteriota bacterium]|nr:DUF4375 domain-containing protein [Acidobacteriota bacterium]